MGRWAPGSPRAAGSGAPQLLIPQRGVLEGAEAFLFRHCGDTAAKTSLFLSIPCSFLFCNKNSNV